MATKMGRPPGTGGPPEKVRRNRCVVMLTDAEFARLRHRARQAGLPPGTLAHRLLAPRLRGRGLGRSR
jgi:hypothetical protein